MTVIACLWLTRSQITVFQDICCDLWFVTTARRQPLNYLGYYTALKTFKLSQMLSTFHSGTMEMLLTAATWTCSFNRSLFDELFKFLLAATKLRITSSGGDRDSNSITFRQCQIQICGDSIFGTAIKSLKWRRERETRNELWAIRSMCNVSWSPSSVN